jgi:hypothetical protein
MAGSQLGGGARGECGETAAQNQHETERHGNGLRQSDIGFLHQMGEESAAFSIIRERRGPQGKGLPQSENAERSSSGKRRRRLMEHHVPPPPPVAAHCCVGHLHPYAGPTQIVPNTSISAMSP